VDAVYILGLFYNASRTMREERRRPRRRKRRRCI
jgi:hypothetical protein